MKPQPQPSPSPVLPPVGPKTKETMVLSGLGGGTGGVSEKLRVGGGGWGGGGSVDVVDKRFMFVPRSHHRDER